MSDTETIIQLLRSVEWRSRANRARQHLATGLSLLLAVMVALRIWTILVPLSRFAIVTIVSIFVALFMASVAAGLRRKGTLDEAAVSVDRTAALQDEIRTAFWFINNPRSSEWVERQLQRAAARARDINVERAYPTSLPPASYAAAAMVVVLVGLSFVKGPIAAFGDTRSNQRTAGVAASRDAQFSRDIRAGLQEIARAFRQSPRTTPIAEAIERQHLDIAADELRDISAEVGIGGGTDQEILQSFRQAAANDQSGLKVLSNALGELAKAMERHEVGAAQEYAEEAAQELERIEEETLPREAGDDRQASRETEASAAPPGGGDTTGLQEDADTPAAASDAAGAGGFGRGRQQGVREGAPVSLEVKLERERLKGLQDGRAAASSLEIQEATKREQSSRDYQNPAPELTPARRDVLNRTNIPWEYRPLIKAYFQAIHGSTR